MLHLSGVGHNLDDCVVSVRIVQRALWLAGWRAEGRDGRTQNGGVILLPLLHVVVGGKERERERKTVVGVQWTNGVRLIAEDAAETR